LAYKTYTGAVRVAHRPLLRQCEHVAPQDTAIRNYFHTACLSQVSL